MERDGSSRFDSLRRNAKRCCSFLPAMRCESAIDATAEDEAAVAAAAAKIAFCSFHELVSCSLQIASPRRESKAKSARSPAIADLIRVRRARAARTFRNDIAHQGACLSASRKLNACSVLRCN
jgi:hypothetical protein